ncbi:Semaphorin-5A [Manis pentadactyla]|nr:Semaphorin-5A [Manis pentadactyla]
MLVPHLTFKICFFISKTQGKGNELSNLTELCSSSMAHLVLSREFATPKALDFLGHAPATCLKPGHLTYTLCSTTPHDSLCGMVGQGLYANLMERNLQDAQKFILMHEVQPVTPMPHFMEDNSCFSHVAMGFPCSHVDVLQGWDMLIHIINLATDTAMGICCAPHMCSGQAGVLGNGAQPSAVAAFKLAAGLVRIGLTAPAVIWLAVAGTQVNIYYMSPVLQDHERL